MSTTIDTQASGLGRMIPLRDIRVSKTNPRTRFDDTKLQELTESIRIHGVIQPIVVRPKGQGFEIVAGERRYRAAKAAGLEEIPAVPRELDDTAVLEIQVLENLNRDDLHPLEEAEGYKRLIEQARYDVARIAERIGRSVAYVYDRLRLLQLTDNARQLFLDGTITAGHAVVLSRLKPSDQTRALQPESSGGGLFQHESLLWSPNRDDEDDDPAGDEIPDDWVRPEGLKPRTVRELQGWVDKNVRFDREAEDVPQLFPDTAATLAVAQEETEKVISITHSHHVPPEAKDGTRTYGPASWKRADGKHDSEFCYHSVTGVIVVGPNRGEAFKVCIEKKKCPTHWGDEMRAAKKKAAAATGGKKEQDSWAREQAKREAERKKNVADRARWEKAEPEVIKAFVDRFAALPANGSGLLGKYILKEFPWTGPKVPSPTAEDLVRLVALSLVTDEIYGPTDAQRVGKTFGVDVDEIMDRVAPLEAPAPAAAKKKGAAAKGAKTDAGKVSKPRKKKAAAADE